MTSPLRPSSTNSSPARRTQTQTPNRRPSGTVTPPTASGVDNSANTTQAPVISVSPTPPSPTTAQLLRTIPTALAQNAEAARTTARAENHPSAPASDASSLPRRRPIVLPHHSRNVSHASNMTGFLSVPALSHGSTGTRDTQDKKMDMNDDAYQLLDILQQTNLSPADKQKIRSFTQSKDIKSIEHLLDTTLQTTLDPRIQLETAQILRKRVEQIAEQDSFLYKDGAVNKANLYKAIDIHPLLLTESEKVRNAFYELEPDEQSQKLFTTLISVVKDFHTPHTGCPANGYSPKAMEEFLESHDLQSLSSEARPMMLNADTFKKVLEEDTSPSSSPSILNYIHENLSDFYPEGQENKFQEAMLDHADACVNYMIFQAGNLAGSQVHEATRLRDDFKKLTQVNTSVLSDLHTYSANSEDSESSETQEKNVKDNNLVKLLLKDPEGTKSLIKNAVEVLKDEEPEEQTSFANSPTIKYMTQKLKCEDLLKDLNRE